MLQHFDETYISSVSQFDYLSKFVSYVFRGVIHVVTESESTEIFFYKFSAVKL